MIPAVSAPAVKWLWPPIVFAAAGLLAIDGTQLSIAAVGFAQAVVIAFLGYRQVRDKNQQDRAAADLQTRSTLQTTRIDGQDRLIDQLQETSTTDRQLIAVLQAEIGNLNAQVLQLQRELLAERTGTMRLVVQLQENDLEPVWWPAADQGDG